jgi:predicted N-acetyltransferase YhbS
MVHMLMYESGYPREPMVKHLGLCNGLHSIPDSDDLMEDLIMTHNMSLLAKDRTTNTPLGLVINGEFTMKDVENNQDDLEKKLQGLSDSSFGPILVLRHEVDSMGAVVFDKFNTDTIFNTKFLMVKPEMSKQGLATGLLSRAIQQASALGYKGIKTVVSHNGFKKAAMDNGMEMVAEVKFDEFIFKGKKVFSDIRGHSSCAFMARKL